MGKIVFEKVMMVVGLMGFGKIIMVNVMINYVIGVQWKDVFCFKMIEELFSN